MYLSSDQGLSLPALATLSLRQYFATLKATIGYLFVAVLVSGLLWWLHPWLPPLLQHESFIGAVVTFVYLSVFLCSFYAGHCVLQGTVPPMRVVLRRLVQRGVFLLIALVFYVAAVAVIGFFGGLLVDRISEILQLSKQTRAVMHVSGTGMPLTYIAVLLLYLLPLVMIESVKPWVAFARVAYLVRDEWLRVFSVYFCWIFLFVALVPRTLHAQWLLAQHGLYFPVCLLVLALIVPFAVNYSLYVLDDLMIRQKVDFSVA